MEPEIWLLFSPVFIQDRSRAATQLGISPVPPGTAAGTSALHISLTPDHSLRWVSSPHFTGAAAGLGGLPATFLNQSGQEGRLLRAQFQESCCLSWNPGSVASSCVALGEVLTSIGLICLISSLKLAQKLPFRLLRLDEKT